MRLVWREYGSQLRSRVCRRDSGCGSKDEAGAEAASASDVMSVTCPLPLARLGQLQTDTGKYLNTTTLYILLLQGIIVQ
jgi:hypothetical protein